MNITSPSFPKGAQCTRTEQETRSMLDVIRAGVMPCLDRACPWCGGLPLLPKNLAGRFVVGCENPDCYAVAQVSGSTPEEALRRWNGRAA